MCDFECSVEHGLGTMRDSTPLTQRSPFRQTPSPLWRAAEHKTCKLMLGRTRSWDHEKLNTLVNGCSAVRTQRSRCANVVADARHRFLIRERRLVSRFRRGHNSRVARMARLGPDITRQSHEEFPFLESHIFCLIA